MLRKANILVLMKIRKSWIVIYWKERPNSSLSSALIIKHSITVWHITLSIKKYKTRSFHFQQLLALKCYLKINLSKSTKTFTPTKSMKTPSFSTARKTSVFSKSMMIANNSLSSKSYQTLEKRVFHLRTLASVI